MADVTCPYELSLENMHNAWNKKIRKYEEGFSHLQKLGKKLTVLPIVVGSLGTWWKPTTKSLVQLGIEQSTVNRVIPELCSMTLEYSKNIYWNHIYGDSFKKPPLQFGGDKPKGNSWKKDKGTTIPTSSN